MKRKLKGSITIFLTIVFAAFILVYTILTDIIKYKQAISRDSCASKTAGDFLSVQQNDDYLDDLGFSFYYEGTSANDYKKAIGEQLAALGNTKSNINVIDKSISIGANDCRKLPEVLGVYSQFHGNVEEIESIEISLYELAHSSTILGPKKEKLMEIAGTDSTQVNSYYNKGFYELFLDRLNYSKSISQSDFDARKKFSRYGEAAGNIWTLNDTLPMGEKQSLTQNMINGAWALSDYVKNGPFYRTDNYFVHGGEDDISYTNNIFILQYANDFLKNITDEEEGKSGLCGELEYILFGYRSDKENVARACELIMEYRYAANLYTIITEGQNHQNVKNLAENEKNAAMCNWALNESLYDVLTLLNGGSIETIKKINSFKTNPNTDPSVINPGNEKSGLNYVDYLRYIALYSVTCMDMVSDEMMLIHLANWIKYSTGLDVDEMYTSKDFKVLIQPKIKSFSFVGEIINHMEATTLDFRIGHEYW